MKTVRPPRTCKVCDSYIVGRSDKQFCCIDCKNAYHIDLRKGTAVAVQKIDKILHRNYAILLELMPKNAATIKVDRKILDSKNFNTTYYTRLYKNSRGKIYHQVYDYAWMEFSDGEILIVRNNS